eukprot:4560853-Alexandrium_andersonii.AAC.1
MPPEAFPDYDITTGRSYTKYAPASKSRVEVQLANKCFRVKGVAEGMPMPEKPNVAWKANGGIELAWAEAKARSGRA